MTRVKDIEKAVKNLPKKDLHQFRHWFAMYDAEKWEGQIETDVTSGKLDALADAAIGEYNKGN